MAFLFLLFFALLFPSQVLPLPSQNSTLLFLPNSSLCFHNTNTNNGSFFVTPHIDIEFRRGLSARILLLTNAAPAFYGDSLVFALAFFCSERSNDTCQLAVLLLETANGFVTADQSPQPVWMANRNSPLHDRAKLCADPLRGLVLIDFDGEEVWSTDLPRHSAFAVALLDTGNLVIINNASVAIWDSFDHPTDTLLVGQVLGGRRRLTSSLTKVNARGGKFYLSTTDSALTAFVRGDKPVAYLRLQPMNAMLNSVRFTGTNFTFLYDHQRSYYTKFSDGLSFQLVRLDADGGIRGYFRLPEFGWSGKLLFSWLDECRLPMACGKYGVCSTWGCSCPKAVNRSWDDFLPSKPESPNAGCKLIPPLLGMLSVYQYRLVDFGNLSYFSYYDPNAAVAGLTELEACKKACDGNSSCKAAFFRYGSSKSQGVCYLPSEVLTIIGGLPIEGGDMNNSVAFIKVLDFVIASDRNGTRGHAQEEYSRRVFPMKVSVLVAVLALCIAISWIVWKKFRRASEGWEGTDCFEQVVGAPMRFSYKELVSATGKFSTRLGKGGFGTVFKGELKDGTPIAVKRLDRIEQGTSEFLAEMKTMGSIRHINLVKLVGFCAYGSNRLLVYEYISNGSLDKWIFDEEKKQALNWETRRRIITDVAKGLAYLHEECSQRIAHLDVKPHNILLDENFNAKISDFGLSRFIDRNQSHVVTGMRGTFGYLAPEWQQSRITVKADIYSFGIVVLEAVSGRMNLDYSQEDANVHLLGVLQRNASEDRAIDIVDEKIVDWECQEEDIMKMIRIGVWCLNEDQAKRPCMSTVVKVLEGTMEFEHNIEFKFPYVLVLSSKSSPESPFVSSSKSLNKNS